MIRDQKEAKRYEDKLTQLNIDLNKKAGEYSTLVGHVEQAKSDLAQREKDTYNAGVRLDLIKQDIVKANAELKVLADKFTVDSANYPKEIARLMDLEKEYQRQAAEAGRKAVIAAKKVKALEASAQDLEKRIVDLKSDVKSLEARANKAQAVIEKCDADKIAQEQAWKEIRDERKKNGVMLTKSELNLRTLEVYARRLQRYYNQKGIRINVLKGFNIKIDK